MNKAQAIDLMILLEGGETNLAGDPGGHTKYGIIQRTLDNLQIPMREYDLPVNVADLTAEQAFVIYDKVDWQQIHGDELPGTLAPLMLNAAVNEGEPTAVGLLQECIGVTVDYTMGPHTLEAIKTWKSRYMPGQTLAEEFAAHVGVKYASLYAKEGQFELGWMRRLFRVYTLAVSS